MSLIWIALVTMGSRAVAQQRASNACVRIFDGTSYRFKPDFASFGIEPAYVFGVLRWWNPGASRDELPPRKNVQAWARSSLIRDLSKQKQLLIPDLEHWPVRGNRAAVQRSLDGYLTLLEWTRAEYNGPIGFYGIPPLRDYWRAIEDPGSPKYREWQAENNAWQALAAKSDVLLPSIYMFYDDMAGWERYAIANLREARRLAGRKPVYAFLGPQYHDSNKKLGGQYVTAEVWKRELEIVSEHADGAVIFGGWDKGPVAWDEKAAWWQATKAFLTPRLPCPRPPTDVRAAKRTNDAP